MIYEQQAPKNTEPNSLCLLTPTRINAMSCQSTPIPLAVNVVIVLFLVNALLVHASRRRRGGRDRRRRQHLGQALELFTLPLDFADTFAAFSANVLGQFDQAEDVFLFWWVSLCFVVN